MIILIIMIISLMLLITNHISLKIFQGLSFWIVRSPTSRQLTEICENRCKVVNTCSKQQIARNETCENQWAKPFRG